MALLPYFSMYSHDTFLSVVNFVGGLFFGLGAAVQHYTLRFWLWRTHLFPWQAVPFLDDAVEQLLLRKVGGDTSSGIACYKTTLPH